MKNRFPQCFLIIIFYSNWDGSGADENQLLEKVQVCDATPAMGGA